MGVLQDASACAREASASRKADGGGSRNRLRQRLTGNWADASLHCKASARHCDACAGLVSDAHGVDRCTARAGRRRSTIDEPRIISAGAVPVSETDIAAAAGRDPGGRRGRLLAPDELRRARHGGRARRRARGLPRRRSRPTTAACRHGGRLGARGLRDRQRRGRLRRWRSSSRARRGAADESPRTAACAFASASTSATCSRRPTARSTATASTSPPGSRAWPSRAASRSPTRSSARCASAWPPASRTSASSRSRTSPSRCAPTGSCAPAAAATGAPASPPRRGTAPRDRVDKPSIAVLPFNNMSGDAEQEFFADGITEDIITELSRFRELFVISRNSSFKYKGRAVDVAEVRARARRPVRRRGQRAQGRQAGAHHGAADRRRDRPPRLGRALRPRPRGHLRDPGRGDARDRRDAAGPRRGGRARPRRAHDDREHGRLRVRPDRQGAAPPQQPRGQREGAAPARAGDRARPELRPCPCLESLRARPDLGLQLVRGPARPSSDDRRRAADARSRSTTTTATCTASWPRST